MQETGSQTLDKIDSLILNELTLNARVPVATLSKCVNLSRNAVQKRIARMEKNNIISRYTIERGDIGGSWEKTKALIMIDRQDRMRGSDVIIALKKIPEVQFCFVLSGKFDLVIQLSAVNAERVMEICSEIWQLPGVLDTRSYFVLASLIDRQ